MEIETDERHRANLPSLGPAASTWLLGALIGLCSWSYLGAVPAPNVDASWVLGLQMAPAQGLHFGTDVIFTYGPLGFLQAPVAAISPYAELGGMYTLAVRIGLGVTLVWATRRNFPLWLAAPVSLLVALLLIQEPIITIVLVWCLVALGPAPPAIVGRLFIPIAAVVVAIEMLGKLSVGPPILVVCTITVLAGEGRRLRRLTTFAGTFALTLAALWLAAGQTPADLVPFARGSLEIVSGYSKAMPLSTGNDEGVHILAAIGMPFTGLLGGLLATRGLPILRRAAVSAVILIAGFAVWKMAFVRFVPPTFLYLFTVMLTPWLAFPWRQIPLWKNQDRTVDGRMLAVAAIMAIAAIYFPLAQQPLSILDPVHRVRTATDQLADLVLPGRLDRISSEARTGLVQYYRLDRGTRALLQGHSVNVDPSEIAIAWGYRLNWRPLPVFQAYSAFTPYLDRRNEELLLADDGPERVLRTFTALAPYDLRRLSIREAQAYNAFSNSDGRFRSWDQPRTTLAMLCNFQPLSTTAAYQVLARGPNRCGRPRPLGSAEGRFGEEIPVPVPPGRQDVVFADVSGLAPGSAERLRTLFYRAPQYYVRFSGVSPQYRFVPTEGEDLILRTSPHTDLPRPFALAPQAVTVRFDKEPTRLSSSHDLTLHFYAMRVGPAPAQN